MARDLAIDLGTANTLVYMRGRGIVLNEPTVIAVNQRTEAVLAMGTEAYRMIGRTPSHIVAVRPMRGGAIQDFETTQRLLTLLFRRVGIGRFPKPRVLICVPSIVTEVERRAVVEAVEQAGAKKCYVIEEPMAAAVGARLPVHEPVGNMVVDVGGGATEVACISLGGIVAARSIRVGGFDLDAAITNYVRREYAVAIGERTAEDLKISVGSAFPTRDETKAQIRGRDLASGLPKTLLVTSEEVREAIHEEIEAIVGAVRQALSDTPPELSQDLLDRGIHLVGGGSLLRGLDARLARETGIPVHPCEMALECVALGAGRALESLDDLRGLFVN
ncbi:MAG: rod shape-determining protein [Actinomycetota bacterium]